MGEIDLGRFSSDFAVVKSLAGIFQFARRTHKISRNVIDSVVGRSRSCEVSATKREGGGEERGGILSNDPPGSKVIQRTLILKFSDILYCVGLILILRCSSD